MAKILVIEDDPTIRHAYTKIFQEHEVMLVDSKPNRKKIEEADIVISDFLGMDFSATKRTCEILTKPLVLVSASAPNGTHQHQLEKPFNLDDLVNKVDSLIR